MRYVYAILTFVFLLPVQAYAADSLSEGSLAISPFIIETSLEPGQSYSGTITVFNVTDAALPIAISINDFVPSGTQGSVRFLDDGVFSHKSFSLASWIHITDQPEFTIPPKGKTEVAFTITVPEEAEPGTHYGGILFASRNASQDTAGTSVIKKLGTLILVSAGKTHTAGSITEFKTIKKLYTDPRAAFVSTFQNNGNVHLAPKGQIRIKNSFGKLVGESHMNTNAQFILPQQARTFESTFQKPWLFGRYRATLTYYYGSPRLEAHATVTFWVIPIKILSLYGGGALALIGLGYIALKRYNHWVIQRAKNRYI